MKRVWLVLLVALCFWACRGNQSAEEAAMEAVEDYYGSLLEGDYEAFLAGRADMDDAPASFREQLLVAYKQFLRHQQEAHMGVTSFSASRATMDSTFQQMQVFLLVNYGDSVQEEIVVPMVERNGEWKMK